MPPPNSALFTHAFAVLQAAPLFATLEAPIITALAQAATRHTYQTQVVVFLMGASDDGLYLVESGWLKALKSVASGREQTIATFGPGAVLNDVAVLAHAPNQATVVALEPSTLWRIPQADMLALIVSYPTLAQVLISNLAARVLHLANLVEDLALRSVEARLARLLLTQTQGDTIERRRWATQAELAAQVGTVPDVLNRALRSLAAAGLIAVERRRIHILDRAGLMARVQTI